MFYLFISGASIGKPLLTTAGEGEAMEEGGAGQDVQHPSLGKSNYTKPFHSSCYFVWGELL